MNPGWKVSTYSGDFYIYLWIAAISFYIFGDGLTTWHMIYKPEYMEANYFTRVLIMEYGVVVWSIVKVMIMVGGFIIVQAIPDWYFTWLGESLIDPDLAKAVVVPLVAAAVGLYMTVSNLLLLLR